MKTNGWSRRHGRSLKIYVYMCVYIYIIILFAYTMITARDEAIARAAGVNSGRPKLKRGHTKERGQAAGRHARGRCRLDRQDGGGQGHGQPSAHRRRGGLGVRHAQISCGHAMAARAARGGLDVEAPPFL